MHPHTIEDAVPPRDHSLGTSVFLAPNLAASESAEFISHIGLRKSPKCEYLNGAHCTTIAVSASLVYQKSAGASEILMRFC
jgi:hypothetical protein